ncbi:MAG: signal peptide peptidase SppA [Candidatus Omnitrophica bacterium]|nr:signal peptide peptidase SppA [Candidatus Omnitrophota bacterium]
MEITDFAAGQHWAITKGEYESLAERIESYKPTAEEIKAYSDILDDGNEDYQVINGVAIIPVSGPITRASSFWSWLFGGTSIAAINELLSLALNDYKVEAILFVFNSPGGTVAGVDALSQAIMKSREQKPIVAFADGAMLSAAYWLGSAADVVVADKTAMLGSIGAIMEHRDLSKADEMMGMKRTYIASGKYKAFGNDAEPLSTEAKQMYQNMTDYIYSVFVDAVARNRDVSVEDVLANMADGRDFIGQQAVDAGVADMVGTVDDALNLALVLIDEQKQQNYQYARRENQAMDRTQILARLGLKKADAAVTTEMLAAGFPEQIGQLVDEAHAAGVASVNLEAAGKEAAAQEQMRIMALAAAYFGKEAAAKFQTLATTGMTPEQVQALGLSSGIGESAEEKAKKEDILKAIQNSGAYNPGAGGNTETSRDFMALVDAYQKQEGCTRSVAIKIIANTYPKEHQTWIEDVNRKNKK